MLLCINPFLLEPQSFRLSKPKHFKCPLQDKELTGSIPILIAQGSTPAIQIYQSSFQHSNNGFPLDECQKSQKTHP